MKVNINSVHFKADRKLEDFIQQKIDKLTSHYDEILAGEVHLKLDNNGEPENKIAEIRLTVRGSDLYAKKQSKSFEEATDTAVEALRRQLKKYKEKIRSK
ncbi:MAG: ribosome-associated translation inhibitor RaiA [Bacteroidetes bacterium]|nr:ribosome-associated translation inhibitor RaiA [Bacteroidota bacterium]